MIIAQVVLLCIQCFNLFLVISVGISMAISNSRFDKRQLEYRKKQQEILNRYLKEKNNGDEKQDK